MSAPTLESHLSKGSSISYHLSVAKEELQDDLPETSVSSPLGRDELLVLEEKAHEVLTLIRTRRNRLAPINRLPSDILLLTPDYWSGSERAENAINLTHVCQSWREIFVPCASLWTDFHCMDVDKTRVYLQRSRSTPINVWLERKSRLARNDPFLQIAPHAISRLKYLSVRSTPDEFQEIFQHLFLPAPLLEVLAIDGIYMNWNHNPTLAAELFDGDLSSLRELHLRFVRTELPWKNMSKLTSFSFSLSSTSGPTISIENFLDFFESSPHLVEVKLFFGIMIPARQGERFVGLKRLKRLSISGSQPPRLLLDHLIVPIGANVSTKFGSSGPRIEDHLPRSLDNLRNFSHFTKIRLRYEILISVRFTGPNGQVSIASSSPCSFAQNTVPRSLAQLDTSKTRCLEIVNGGLTPELREAIASLTNLHTLILSKCTDYRNFLHRLSDLACPKLEELVIRTSGWERFDMTLMICVADKRASEGTPLRLVKLFFGGNPVAVEEVVSLRELVGEVEISVEAHGEDTDEEC